MKRKYYKFHLLAKFLLKKADKAVSLPEVLIATFIITTSLIIFLTLASNQLRTLKFAQQNFIANYVAFEGLQLVLAYRNSLIDQENWLGSLAKRGEFCIHFDNGFYIEEKSDCNNGQLFLKDGRYLHSVGQRIPYKRLISLEDFVEKNKVDLSDSEFVKVKSTVNSPAGNSTLEMIISKWHPLFK